MEVFRHHIYEYKKGLRRMILHTAPSCERELMEAKLRSLAIAYFIMPVAPSKINVFFGDSDCVRVIRSFNIESLSSLTREQDFILGALLGYDLKLQSRRFLSRIEAASTIQRRHEKEECIDLREELVYDT
jgi:hypothetical protein